MRPRLALSVTLLLGACAPEPVEVRLILVPAQAIGCQPTEVRSLTLRPLGDSPRETRPSVRVELGRVSTIPSFPPATERVEVAADGIIERFGGVEERWRGAGVALLGQDDELRVPLLRLRRGCALPDAAAGLPPGGVVTTLGDARLLIAGGDRGLDDLRLVVVRMGEPLARVFDLNARPRVFATATALGGELVLLAGGRGRESFEVVGVDREEVLSEGLLRGPRSEHDAVRLPDGRVLLIGGRSETGAARRDAELLEIDEDGRGARARRAAGELSVARIRPTARVLDDGTVLVLGGVDDAGVPVAEVERFDPSSERFTSLGAPWPPRLDSAYAALSGGRLARVGGQDGGAWSRSVELLLERGETHVSLDAALADELARPRAVGLGDGRVLVIGSAGGAPTAQIVDPGGSRDAEEARLDPIDVGQAPTQVVRMVEGTAALVGADGVSLLRNDLTGPFTDPPASINPAQLDGRDELSLDGPARWRADGDLLRAAVDGARLDVPSSRFSGVRIELSYEGRVELLLTADGAPPHAVELADTARVGDCSVRSDGVVVMERRGAELRLASGGREQTCGFTVAATRVGVAVRASRDAGVRRLSVSRL